jgi:hypothetical protein
MAEEILDSPKTAPSLPQAAAGKPQSKWFRKIPKEVLGSTGGMVLIIAAGVMELVDLIPVPIIDNLWELPLEIIFMILLVNIAKIPFQGLIIPFIVERIPGISDIVPTWLIRLFM